MVSHGHDCFAASQNLGNSLGTRPCVRQTPLYRQRESGNAMKELMGMSHLAWGEDHRSVASSNSVADRATSHAYNDDLSSSQTMGRVASAPSGRLQATYVERTDARSIGGYPAAHQHVPPSYATEPRQAWSSVSNPARVLEFEDRKEAQGRRPSAASGTRPGARQDQHQIRQSSSPPGASQQSASSAGDLQRGRGRGRGSAAPRRPPTPSQPYIAKPNGFANSHGASAFDDSPPAASSMSSVAGSAASRTGSAPTPKISTMRFDSMRVAPVFGAHGSRFAEAYAHGALPCHIDHGTCKNRITWDIPADELQQRREALLVLCVDGLRETRHPHATVARLAYSDLAASNHDSELSDDTLRQVMSGLRLALLADGTGAQKKAAPKVGASAPLERGVFESALDALRQIFEAEGPRLAPHLHLVIPPLSKHMFSKTYRDGIQSVLRDISKHGGPAAVDIMRARGVSVGVR